MAQTIHEHMYSVDLNEPLIRRFVGLLGNRDVNANRFGARLTRDGADADITGYSVRGYFIRPDESTVLVNGVIDGNLVYVDMPENCYYYNGACTVSIKISNEDITQTVLICDSIICQTISEEVIEDDYKILSVVEIAEKMAEVDAVAKEASRAAKEADEITKDALSLVEVIVTSLENGEFNGKDGEDGEDGVGIASVTVTKSPDENGFYYINLNLTDGQHQIIPYKHGDDGKGIASAVLNADYTLTFEYTDGTSYTTPSIRGAKGADAVSISSIQQTTTSTANGGTNVVTVALSNGQKSTFEVKNGQQGTPGYTPVKKQDYFTDEEVAAIQNEVNTHAENYIATELAKRGQTQPEFANSIDECTDTSKLYVLPDGNIYAYMTTTGPTFTDVIATSIGSDGKPYNGGLGYKTGIQINTSGGEMSNANSVATGFIPIKNINDFVVKISGKTGALTNNDVMKFYNASFGNISLDNNDRMDINASKYGGTFAAEPAFDNTVNTFTFSFQAFKSKSGYYSGLLTSGGAAYVRFSIVSYDLSKFVAAVNEDIGYGTSAKWTNTGHAFVPADYEDRIIDLEQASADHANRIRTLEMYGADSPTGEDIPAYIKTAADEVIEKVISQQGNRSFTMIGMSDFHYGGTGDNKNNLIRACKAVSYISGRINVDAIATLGDNIPHGESTASTLASGHRWFKEINEILGITQQPGVIDFRTPGNHDRMGGNNSSGNPTEPMPDNAIYSYIGGYNRQCEIGNVPGGWAYKDFNGHKLRVIVMNTSEVEGKGRFSTHSGFHMSTAQYRWLIDTLNLSSKPDADDWQIVLLSHHRADDWQVEAKGENTYILPNILNAYNTGGSYTGVNAEDNATISCNFAGKNAAKLIGQIHGHHHAYIYGYLGLRNGGTPTNVMAISTPTTAFGTGAGHNDDNNDVWYDSVKDTAEETAFCVYSIDLDNHVIHAIHYGNGIDRVINY